MPRQAHLVQRDLSHLGLVAAVGANGLQDPGGLLMSGVDARLLREVELPAAATSEQ